MENKFENGLSHCPKVASGFSRLGEPRFPDRGLCNQIEGILMSIRKGILMNTIFRYEFPNRYEIFP